MSIKYLVIIPWVILLIAGVLIITLSQSHSPTTQLLQRKPDVFEQIQKKNVLIEQTASTFYQLGVAEAVAFYRFTGVVPNTPALQEALWKRRQPMMMGHFTPLMTAEEAQKILEESRRRDAQER